MSKCTLHHYQKILVTNYNDTWRSEQGRQEDGSRRLRMLICVELLLLINVLLCTGSGFHTFYNVLRKWHNKPVPIKKQESTIIYWHVWSSGQIFCGPWWTIHFDNGNTFWRFWFDNWCFHVRWPQSLSLSLSVVSTLGKMAARLLLSEVQAVETIADLLRPLQKTASQMEPLSSYY